MSWPLASQLSGEVRVIHVYPAALVLGVLLLGVVVKLLRRRQLREKYAALRIVVGLGSVVLAVFPAGLATVAVLLAAWLARARPRALPGTGPGSGSGFDLGSALERRV